MKTVFITSFILFLPFLFLAGCSSHFAGDTLVALPVEGGPTGEDWERAVPLDMKVWMGNVNIAEEIISLDMETSHRSTPECHHGPSTSEPVDVRIQALYNREELFLLLRWTDQTMDRELGTWEKGPEGWNARPGADDGIAILWEQMKEPAGSRDDEDSFRCQYACHMMEVDVYDGGTNMRMGMKTPEGEIMDLWRWRASVTGPFGLADDMVIDEKGKRGDEGQILPRENRSAVSTGPERISGSWSPFYIVEEPRGRQGDVKAIGRWEDGEWRLSFRRALDTSDPDDVAHFPGSSVPFSVSVFDNTFSEHHVSESSAVLVLWKGEIMKNRRREIDEAMDF